MPIHLTAVLAKVPDLSRIAFAILVALLIGLAAIAMPGDSQAQATAEAPIAFPSVLSTIEVGKPLALDASDSLSPSGAPLTYAWRLLRAPTGSTATFDDAAAVRPRLVLDVAGDYEIELTVSAGSVSSGPVVFIVSTEHPVPAARLSATRHPSTGRIVFDGSQSFDPDGGRLTYAWVVVSAPEGSNAALSQGGAVSSLMPDVAGSYTVELTVSDVSGATSLPHRITVASHSSSPVADAGVDRRSEIGAPTVLDPFLSTDLDGSSLVSSWSLVSAPFGSVAALSVPALGRVSLTPDVAGDYVAQLTIHDGTSASHDSVVITVGPGRSVPPVARTNVPLTVSVGGTATLDATASNDADGDLLSFKWSVISAPAASTPTFSDATSARTGLRIDAEGTYIVSLQVTDQTGLTSFATTQVTTTGGVPLAEAGADQKLVATGTASATAVDGIASSHTTGEPLTYQWTILGLTASGDPKTGQIAAASAPATAISFPPVDATIPVAASHLASSQAIVLEDLNSDSTIAGPTVIGRSVTGHRFNVSAWTGATATSSLLTVARDINGGKKRAHGPGLVKVGGRVRAPLDLLDGATLENGAVDLASVEVDLRAWSIELGQLQSTGPSGDPRGLTGDCRAQHGHGHDNGHGHGHGDGRDRDHGQNRGNGRNHRQAHAGGPLAHQSHGAGNGSEEQVGRGDHHNGDGHHNSGLDIVLVAQPDARGLAVLNLRECEDVLSSERVDTIDIQLNGAQAFVINVAGSSIGFDRARFIGGATSADVVQRVVWNFYEASHVRISKTFYGAILAPRANAQNSAAINGAVVFERMEQRAPILGGGFAGGTAFMNQLRPVDAAVVQLTVSDQSRVAADTVLVTKGNIAPVAAISAPVEVDIDAPVQVDATGSYDANADTMTYRWGLIHRPNGSAALLSSGTGLQATFTPDRRGVYLVQLVVNDGTLDSAYRTLAIAARNRPPVFASTPVFTARTGQEYKYELAATDADGDAVAFALTSAPAGVTLTSNVVAWTPQDVGTFPISVRATDGHGGAVDQTFEVVVEPGGNRAPVLTAVGSKSVTLGQMLRINLLATDPDGDPISYTAYPLPAGATLDVRTGVFSFRPVSAHPSVVTLTFAVSDGSARDEETISLNVVAGDPGQPNGLSGRVLDANDLAAGAITPVEGATVVSGSLQATTDANGEFSFVSVPVGALTLEITRAGYVSASVSMTTFAGVETSIDPDIKLARITGTGTTVPPGGGVTISNPAVPGVTGTIASGTATNPDGTPFEGTLTLADVPPSSVPLPPTLRTCSVQTIAASSPVQFNPPMPVTLPNRDNLPAETAVIIWSFDRELRTFIRSGSGRVSTDAATIVTESGGISSDTAFLATPLALDSTPGSDQPSEGWSPSLLGEGNLRAAVAASGYESIGLQRQPALIYNSTTASPRPLISSVVAIPADRAIPGTLEARLFVGGIELPNALVTSLSTPADVGGAPIDDARNETVAQQVTFDASWLPTGYHEYRLLTFANYACTAIASERKGRIFVNNHTESPFGRGWTSADIQTLHVQADGSALVEEADGSLTRFEKKQAVADFNRASLRFEANGGSYPVVADFDLDGRKDLAFANNGDGKVRVYINRGSDSFVRKADVTFGTGVTIPVTGIYRPDLTDVTAADLNRDGIPDLISSQQIATNLSDQRGVRVAYGNGDGSFRPAVVIPETANRAFATVRVTDMDADGILDLVTRREFYRRRRRWAA